MIAAIIKWLGQGALGRVLETVDKKIEAQSDRERIKSEIIKESYRTRGEYMRAGGFWLMMIFALPLAFWHGSVLVYSVFWCSGCAFPQDWYIAALPPPLNDWAATMIVSIFGVIGVSTLRR